MTMFRMLMGLIAALLTAASTKAAPLSAYGDLPAIDLIEISPDGAKLALATSNGDQRTVAVVPLSGGGAKRYAAGSSKIRRLQWIDAGSLVVTTSQTAGIADILGPRREWVVGSQINLASDKVQPLLRGDLGAAKIGSHIPGADVGMSLNVLVGPPEVRTVDGTPRLFLKGITFSDVHGQLTVFRAGPTGAKAEIIEQGNPSTNDILLDTDGNPVARTEYHRDRGLWELRLRQPSGWKTVRSVEAKLDPPDLVGLGRTAGTVLVAEQGEAGMLLREVSRDGAWSDPIAAAGSDGAIFDPRTYLLIGVRALMGDEYRHTFFDPKDQKAWDAVKAGFKGDQVRLESMTSDRRKMVVRVDTRNQGAAYALVDLDAKRATWLGASYPALTATDIATVEPVRFKAGDGLDLTGYLTVPHGVAHKNLPLVVLPHGGPAARDGPEFDWWAQAIASRGYAVLQVNFRGSDGFGRAFLNAGRGEWGRKMQTDLSDGVRFLASEGAIDPRRVCIVGGSYGGYAALAGVTVEDGPYRCAVSVAGPSDLNEMLDFSRDRGGEAASRYWKRAMGVEDGVVSRLVDVSPAKVAARAKAPILLIHGKDDTVVPYLQSKIMADALRKVGKSVEFVTMKGEDHWLSKGATRLEMLTATVAFLEKHNPPN